MHCYQRIHRANALAYSSVPKGHLAEGSRARGFQPLVSSPRFQPLVLFLILFFLCITITTHAAPPQIIFDTRTGKTISQKDMLDQLAKADVVFVGEQHDDPATHVLELQILQGLSQHVGKRLSLGMEMWERDEQPALTNYLQSKTDEPTFLKNSRPWSNYKTDYRPMIEFAKSKNILVIATNAPQSFVSQVGKEGLDATKTMPSDQVAQMLQAPQDDYWQRFEQVMTSMGGAHGQMDATTIARFYDAQVLRDETMAEAIVLHLGADSDGKTTPVIMHVNGDFHSDYGGGIPRRVLWRRPLTRVLTVTVVPMQTSVSTLPAEDKTRADYVVFVADLRPPDKTAAN